MSDHQNFEILKRIAREFERLEFLIVQRRFIVAGILYKARKIALQICAADLFSDDFLPSGE